MPRFSQNLNNTLAKELIVNNSIAQTHQQEHIEGGDILKSLVYGGLDGAVNTLVVILTGIAAKRPAYQILAFAVAAIIGDGIGMGLGDYLSARAEIAYIQSEEDRQMYEVQYSLEEQKKQIIQIYNEKGFEQADSIRLADLYSTNPKAFVNIMMLEQLGLVKIQEKLAVKCGIVTFVSFIILGALPALPYIVSSGIMKSTQQLMLPVVLIGVIQLFCLGFGKASIIHQNPWKASVQTLILGVVVTLIGYGVGIVFGE